MTEIPHKCPRCNAPRGHDLHGEGDWICGTSRDAMWHEPVVCLKRQVARLGQKLVEWQSECFYQFAHCEADGKHEGWYYAMGRSTLERLGKELSKARVLERHPDGGEWYRPVEKAKENP